MTENYKKRLTGRKPKLNPCTHCVMVRFDDEEYARFMERYRESGVYAKAVFCKAMVFGESFRVLKENEMMRPYNEKQGNARELLRAQDDDTDAETGECIKGDDCVSQRRDRCCPYNSLVNSLVIACNFHSFTSEICADFQQLTSCSLEDSLGKSLGIARNFQPFPSDQIETLPFVSL